MTAPLDPDGENVDSLPFLNYPRAGRNLLGQSKGYNCRHGYGLEFMKLTGQIACAYCGQNLVARFGDWLTMALDHVIPDAVCRKWGLPPEWSQDFTNRVLCCSACNTFGNRYAARGYITPTSLEEFYRVRDAIFVERRAAILRRRSEERAFFEKRLWET